jgi:putative RecB family exonuclease
VRSVPALSYSSYHTYLECPLRWKYLYIDRLPETPRGYFSFGRVIHSALEELVRPLVVPSARRVGGSDTQRTLDQWGTSASKVEPPGTRMSIEELLAVYDRLWISDGYISPEEEARYKSLGRDLLRRFYDEFVREHPQPVSVEEHLEARWEGIPIHGYIDRIDRTASGGLEVVDYKTSRELSGDDARDSDQLSLYQVLVERNYAEPVEGLTLYHLRSQTPIRVPARPPATLDALHVRLGTVLDGIQAEAYDPTPGRQCSRCDFRSICPEFKPVPPLDEARLRLLVNKFQSLREDEHRLEEELKKTAEELHRAAEELGVHRVPGSTAVAIRKREETWQYSLESVRPLLEETGLAGRVASGRAEDVRKVVRDPSVHPEVRRKISETGARRVKWYWDLEEPDGAR